MCIYMKRKALKTNPENSYDKFDRANACSSTECTGLITVPPSDDDELENYHDVYDFGPMSKDK